MQSLDRMDQRANLQIQGELVPPIEQEGTPVKRVIDEAQVRGGMAEQLLRRLEGRQLPLSGLPKRAAAQHEPNDLGADNPYFVK